MVQRHRREIILLGLMAILFVQLCPLFEDPTPLTKVHHPYAPVVVVFLLLSLTVFFEHPRNGDHRDIADPSVPLLDLTCVRLC